MCECMWVYVCVCVSVCACKSVCVSESACKSVCVCKWVFVSQNLVASMLKYLDVLFENTSSDRKKIVHKTINTIFLLCTYFFPVGGSSFLSLYFPCTYVLSYFLLNKSTNVLQYTNCDIMKTCQINSKPTLLVHCLY